MRTTHSHTFYKTMITEHVWYITRINTACKKLKAYLSRQKENIIFFLSTPLRPYTQCIQCAINLTPKRIYAKLSVSSLGAN